MDSACKMVRKTAYVPPELVTTICSYLSKKDLASARLVSKDFGLVATSFLFRSVWYSTDPWDWLNLRRISVHPVLREMVREICYDNTTYELVLCHHKVYIDSLGTSCVPRNIAPWNHPPRITRGVTYSKAAVLRGYKVYTRKYERQRELESFAGDHMTQRHGESRKINRVPKPLLTAIKWCNVKKLEEYLPSDLTFLIQALLRLPRVDALAFSSDRRSDSDRYWANINGPGHDPRVTSSRSFRIENEGQRGVDKVVFDPAPIQISSAPNRSPQRGIKLFILAASISRKYLRSFNVKSEHAYTFGTCFTFLDMGLSDSAMQHAQQAFRNLTTVNLRFAGHDYSNVSQLSFGHKRVYEGGMIAYLLHLANALTNLTLDFSQVFEIDQLSKILGEEAWPRLCRVTLRSMVLSPDQLADFLLLHTPSLQCLGLEDLTFKSVLAPSGPRTEISIMWNRFCKRISALDLHELCITGWSTPEWYSSNFARNQRFLESGGNVFYAVLGGSRPYDQLCGDHLAEGGASEEVGEIGEAVQRPRLQDRQMIISK